MRPIILCQRRPTLPTEVDMLHFLLINRRKWQWGDRFPKNIMRKYSPIQAVTLSPVFLWSRDRLSEQHKTVGPVGSTRLFWWVLLIANARSSKIRPIIWLFFSQVVAVFALCAKRIYSLIHAAGIASIILYSSKGQQSNSGHL